MFLGRLAIAILFGLGGGIWVFASGNGTLAAILTYCGLGSFGLVVLSLVTAFRTRTDDTGADGKTFPAAGQSI